MTEKIQIPESKFQKTEGISVLRNFAASRETKFVSQSKISREDAKARKQSHPGKEKINIVLNIT